MTFLLDTNAVVALMKGHSGLTSHMKVHSPEDFALPAIVWHELRYGAEKSARRVENLARLDRLPFEVVAFDAEDGRVAGEIRATLGRAGTPIGPYDVLIAAQALARTCLLITHNTREFERVAGLRVEDWEAV